MAENTKNYFFVGITGIVLLVLFAVVANVIGFEKTGSPKQLPTAEVTLNLSKEDSRSESFSASVEEERLFSEKPTTVVFSSADTPSIVHLNCTIRCEREGS